MGNTARTECDCHIRWGEHYRTSQKRKARCTDIVATPGRMKDMISRRLVDISKIDYAVLDEADEISIWLF